MRSKVIFFRIIIYNIILLLCSCNTKVSPCFLTNGEAINEIKYIEQLLKDQSPYINIHHPKVLSSLDSLATKLGKKDTIDKYEFSLQLKLILADLKDRHFSLNYTGNCKQENKYYLPFALAPWKDSSAIALVKRPKVKFSFFLNDFPFLTRIDNQKIKEFIHQHDPENKYAPKFSAQALGVEKLNEFYKIKGGLKAGDQMKFTFTSRDFKSDTTLYLKLVESKNKWRDVDSYLLFDKDNDKLNKQLFRQYENQVAYIKIPEMYSYSKDKEYFQWLKHKMDSLRSTNALIIDLRNNSGGKRDLIDFFSGYLIAPRKFWVANLARYRGKISAETKESLNSRRLYSYSDFKDADSRQAIDSFMKNFHPSIEIDEKLYSEYLYMVISGKTNLESYYYNHPVYILTNEMTFSAASVFASTFKGLENIKIAGVVTDGSSGMSKTYALKNSGIQLRLSHMLSYQKTGELFDGIGTSPDIEIHRSIDQILGKEDYQLKTLLKIADENIQ